MREPDRPTIDMFRAQLREGWDDETTVAGWRAMHAKFACQTRAMTAALMRAARAGPGLRALDLASGAGEPALALARAAGPAGLVVATDLSPGMVAAAAAHARQHDLAHLACAQADAHDLPFADRVFDLVTSRLGAMYFPDAARAFGEARRVLRPGGRVALLVWGPPDENPQFALAAALTRHGLLAPPAPGAPSPFAYARPGSLAAALREAGFRRVREGARRLTLPWPGTPGELWRAQVAMAMGGATRAAMAGLTPGQRARVLGEVEATLGRYDDGRRVRVPALVRIATGMR